MKMSLRDYRTVGRLLRKYGEATLDAAFTGQHQQMELIAENERANTDPYHHGRDRDNDAIAQYRRERAS